MLNLYHIYEKFLTLFKWRYSPLNTQIESNSNTDKSEHSAALSFSLLDSDPDIVDIKCLLPNVDNKNVSEITTIAEKYAQLLVLLSSDTFNKNIQDILIAHKKNSNENFKTIMLVDSIISFWDILYEVQTKQIYKKYTSHQPVVKPSDVFKLK